MGNSTCTRLSPYFFLVTMSAAPYLPPAAAGSLALMAGPPSTGSSTSSHLMGIAELKRGPSQYSQLASSEARVPSSKISAPSTGVAPTPTWAELGWLAVSSGAEQADSINSGTRKSDLGVFVIDIEFGQVVIMRPSRDTLCLLVPERYRC